MLRRLVLCKSTVELSDERSHKTFMQICRLHRKPFSLTRVTTFMDWVGGGMYKEDPAGHFSTHNLRHAVLLFCLMIENMNEASINALRACN